MLITGDYQGMSASSLEAEIYSRPSGATPFIARAYASLREDADHAVITVTPVHARGQRITRAEFDETSVVRTRFATSALALLRSHLDEDPAGAIAGARDSLAGNPEPGLAVLARPLCLLGAADLGTDSASPRNLARSVILDGR